MAGGVPHLVQLLQRDDQVDLQFEVAWTLSNVVGGPSLPTMAVIEQGAVPIFVRLLKSPSAKVREQASWALGNVAAESCATRDLVIANGALRPLLDLYTPSPNLAALRILTWSICNLFREKPLPQLHLVAAALRRLIGLLGHPDHEILQQVCPTLADLSNGTGPHAKTMHLLLAKFGAAHLRKLITYSSSPAHHRCDSHFFFHTGTSMTQSDIAHW